MDLLKFIFELYLIVLIVRFFLQLFGANYFNPFTRWAFKLSNPICKPLEKLLPTHGHFNWACLLGIMVFKLIELLIIIFLTLNTFPHVGGLIIVALGDLLYLTATIFFYAIILQAIMSWVAVINRRYFSLQEPLAVLTNPLIRPVQQLLPSLGGIDFSAIPVLIILHLVKTFLFAPIIGLGVQLIFS